MSSFVLESVLSRIDQYDCPCDTLHINGTVFSLVSAQGLLSEYHKKAEKNDSLKNTVPGGKK